MSRLVGEYWILPLFLLCGLAGCEAEMVKKERPRKGPVPEVGFIETGGGEVRYSTEGWGLVVAIRRSGARRRMRRVCKGLEVKITDEFAREDVEVPYSGDDLAPNLEKGLEHYNLAPFQHIVFECVPKEKLKAP